MAEGRPRRFHEHPMAMPAWIEKSARSVEEESAKLKLTILASMAVPFELRPCEFITHSAEIPMPWFENPNELLTTEL